MTADKRADILSLARKTIHTAVELILHSRGKLVVTGMGKSGLIGRKIAATLASTGTPSFFLHPGEAFHGDLGMISPEDTVLALSYSGETDEILKIVPFIHTNGNKLISMTGNPESTLARNSDVHLDVAVRHEACILHLAPTTSTTAQIAMGDAMAVALMKLRNFTSIDFARLHPGGSLGRRLLMTVGSNRHLRGGQSAGDRHRRGYPPGDGTPRIGVFLDPGHGHRHAQPQDHRAR